MWTLCLAKNNERTQGNKQQINVGSAGCGHPDITAKGYRRDLINAQLSKGNPQPPAESYKM